MTDFERRVETQFYTMLLAIITIGFLCFKIYSWIKTPVPVPVPELAPVIIEQIDVGLERYLERHRKIELLITATQNEIWFYKQNYDNWIYPEKVRHFKDIHNYLIQLENIEVDVFEVKRILQLSAQYIELAKDLKQCALEYYGEIFGIVILITIFYFCTK